MSLQQFGETSPLNASRDAIDQVQLRQLCNKSTALCWAYSAQIDDRCPRLIFGCIYEEWSRCHNDEPRIDFEHFFANPVSITSAGPTTISGILEAYIYLYNKTQELALSELAPISTIKRSLYPLTNDTESHRIFNTDKRANKVTEWQTRSKLTTLRKRGKPCRESERRSEDRAISINRGHLILMGGGSMNIACVPCRVGYTSFIWRAGVSVAILPTCSHEEVQPSLPCSPVPV